MNLVELEPTAPLAEDIPPLTNADDTDDTTVALEHPSNQVSRDAIRISLKASTLDGVFATIFSNIAGGVLLSNFLVELEASAVEIGMLSSIPMLVNLLQPLGAYLADRTTSRHHYCLWIFGLSRLIWLALVAGVAIASWHSIDPHQLVICTLLIVLASHILGALGSASWLSWMAILVPQRLRGRYFGVRNSAASFTNLVCVPLAGLLVSMWPGGTLQGYGVVLLIGIVAGLLSLGFQHFMVDVNPQVQQFAPAKRFQITHAKSASGAAAVRSLYLNQVPAERDRSISTQSPDSAPVLWQDANFLTFLLYFGLWFFAVNLSAPFFNLYMLDTLGLDVRCVTLYSSIHAGAHLLMLILWGKVADRTGNRPLLILIGILVAITPLLWLGTGANARSLWVWFPLLHLVSGGTWAAIDLCSNNIQMGVAPVKHHAAYFAIAAAVAGVMGALGTTLGGFVAQFANYGGLPGLFALSSMVRLASLLPLIFVQEQGGRSLKQALLFLLPIRRLVQTNNV
ncbi:MFS transporter [Oculatella sp. LEGE 06141]|uniref:MFS transporter n=1 Tax=Oculatella sp. LEGE 06141 TaxID=1828648 RepID=UPI00187F67AD|nr:MFS transporter [Oculatella sp. LEGE 06141]MBE9179621.1 MFS transporter [Oculatella sp. LEGE 06141]